LRWMFGGSFRRWLNSVSNEFVFWLRLGDRAVEVMLGGQSWKADNESDFCASGLANSIKVVW